MDNKCILNTECAIKLIAALWQDMGLLEMNKDNNGLFTCRSSVIKTYDTNYTLIKKPFDIENIPPIHAVLAVENDEYEKIIEDLKKADYKLAERDVVICGRFSKTNITKTNESLKIAEYNTLSSPDFLNVFIAACYSDDTATEFSHIDNGYLNQFKIDNPHHHQFSHHHFVAYLDGHPVASLSAIHNDDCAGIFNVCTNPKFRQTPYLIDSLIYHAKTKLAKIGIDNFVGMTVSSGVLERWYRSKGGQVIGYASFWEKA